MKFCKLSHIQHEDYSQLPADENICPNLPQPSQLKPVVESLSQEELYRAEIEEYLLASISFNSKCGERNYFAFQTEISEHMRGVLINWLVEVHQKYKLSGETFFLTVRIIDSYLSYQKISRNRLQLLGISALWIAAKYQETYQVPKIDNLVFICDNAYKAEDILSMEGKILIVTGFEVLTNPSPLAYYQMVQYYAKLNQKDYWLGRYLLEATVFDLKINKYPQAVLAYALAFFIKKLRGYSSNGEERLRSKFSVSENQIRAVARQLCSLWQRAEFLECLNSLKSKYSHRQFMEVAKIRLTEKNK